MEVIIISNKKQQFNGKNYWLDKNSGYYRNAHVKPHSLHRQVWIYHNGKIPKGMTIDHIDRNKNNNQIENLRLATYSQNNLNISKEAKLQRQLWAKKIQHLTKKWHKSEIGHEWHRKHAIEAYSKRISIEKICAHCGKEFSTTQYSARTRFCGNNCKMKARRRRLAGLPENAPLSDLKKFRQGLKLR